METIPLDRPTSAAQRQPGDFRRKGVDGPPYVRSLTKTRRPQGLKPELRQQAEQRGIDWQGLTVEQLREAIGDEPAWELYGRPSGYGNTIDDQYNLIKHLERQVALGIAIDPSILGVLDGVESDADERKALDRMANQAHEVAGSNIARDRGTFLHAVTEWADEVEL